jgi:hypothetical protein
MITVELTREECEMACWIGAKRQLDSIMAGLKQKHGNDGEDGYTKNIEGAGGEIAAAKVINRYWGGSVNTFKKGGDVGPYQVRTRSELHWDLIVRDDDRDEDRFILVRGKLPHYQVVGHIYGKAAKRPEFLKPYGNRPPAYFVPANILTPFNPPAEQLRQAVAMHPL